MFSTSPFAARPYAAGARIPRAFRTGAVSGEYGYAAWGFSRQAKLNAWSWHGVGGLLDVMGWATLGSAVYLRNEADDYVYWMQADTFLAEGDTNHESSSVVAATQWLDFGKPGRMKALSGMDMDVLGITTVDIYGFIPNPDDPRDRTPTLLASIPMVDAEAGWTYNGEVIPLEEVGAATEFMLAFTGEANREVQINRVTLYWDEVIG